MPRKLLLADDSITIQRVIELTFADEDVTVTAVGDGDAAIRALDAERPDIVLADIGMPGRDGYQVAQHVHDTPALTHIPVLLLTGAFDPVDDARIRALGCAGVLVKPFEPQMVIARVRELLAASDVVAAGQADRLVGNLSATGSTTADPPPAPQPSDPPPAPASEAGGSGPAPAAQPALRGSAVDDYFARLDAAFATLNVPLDVPRSPHGPSAPDRGAAAAPAGAAPEPVQQAAAPPVTLGDAFGVLLDVEQGEPMPVFGESWQPLVTDDLVDAVARRVTERVSEQIIRELAPDIVSGIAERLVREEIERLRSLQA
jgi:CheY-like chemotaxis protein